MTISRAQAEALATLATRLRDDWEHPGVMAAIGKARDLGPPAAIAAALCRLAENRDMRTPALLAEPGSHWGGTTVASRKPPVMCTEHPTEPAGRCGPCDKAAAVVDYQAKVREVRDALKAARA